MVLIKALLLRILLNWQVSNKCATLEWNSIREADLVTTRELMKTKEEERTDLHYLILLRFRIASEMLIVTRRRAALLNLMLEEL